VHIGAARPPGFTNGGDVHRQMVGYDARSKRPESGMLQVLS
jgi:hypothetical protein